MGQKKKTHHQPAVLTFFSNPESCSCSESLRPCVESDLNLGLIACCQVAFSLAGQKDLHPLVVATRKEFLPKRLAEESGTVFANG